jgi:hypothetical protein
MYNGDPHIVAAKFSFIRDLTPTLAHLVIMDIITLWTETKSRPHGTAIDMYTMIGRMSHRANPKSPIFNIMASPLVDKRRFCMFHSNRN